MVDWIKFNTYNESYNKAFEAMCNQLFELWCTREYKEENKGFLVVNGSGGDGGVEAICTLRNEKYVAVQAKWFPNKINSNEINQIKDSIITAMSIRPNIIKYIVCIPRDLTSKRKVKGNKISSNTEEDKWNNLVTEIDNLYPELELVLWTESTLLREMMYEEAKGVYKFWFHNVEISEEALEHSFRKQEVTWLSERYIPDIHSKGIINYRLSLFLGNYESKSKIGKRLTDFLKLHKKLIKSLSDYLDVIKNDELKKVTMNDVLDYNELVSSKCEKVERFIENYKMGTSSVEEFKNLFFNYDYDNLLDEFKGYSFSSKYRLIRMKLGDAIEKFRYFNRVELSQDLYKESTNSPLIILGERGTGKTHGVADFVKMLQGSMQHLGILIQASSVSKESSWQKILTKSIGLSDSWSEEEIYTALESMCYRKEAYMVGEDDDYKITSKFLICIDGIDECEPYSVWLDRIKECSLISKKYSRIKFCFTSRPYVFERDYKRIEIFENNIQLPSDGDYPVEKLFDSYIEEYDIRINNQDWIKWSLKTPLALKLFCQVYEHNEITPESKAAITITELIRKKIEVIDSEFLKSTGNRYCKDDNIILRVMNVLAYYFYEHKEISRDNLIKLIRDNDGLNMLESSDRGKVIDFMKKHAILYSYTIEDEPLHPPTIMYRIGINTFFEYVLGVNIVGLYKKSDDKQLFNFPNIIKDNNGILQILSIIFLEDYGILINGFNWINENIDNYRLLNLIYFALVSVSPSKCEQYKIDMLFIMEQGRDTLVDCVNKVIIPVSRIKKHPLGARLLHEFLVKFETTYERDVVWSLPNDILEQDYIDPMRLNTKGIYDERYSLENNYNYDDLPLIYGWSLTSLDNRVRKHCRKELTKWGINFPERFLSLLDKLYKVNDQQLREDLLAILKGIVYSNTLDIDELQKYSKWVSNNIFDSRYIVNTLDIAIRYYGRAIIEFAYLKGVVTEEIKQLAVPPYQYNNTLLNLSKEALNGTRMDGYKDISYDLSRYVLCDKITDYFFEERVKNNNYDEDSISDVFTLKEVKKYLESGCLSIETEIKLEELMRKLEKADQNKFDLDAFLSDMAGNEDEEVAAESENEEYLFHDLLIRSAQKIGVDNISPEQYIISTAFNYLKDVGMYKIKYENINDDPVNLIGRWYHPATHGQQSLVMDFAEKYIWCFRNILIGYLADRLPYCEGPEGTYLTDYGLTNDFLDTYFEMGEDIIKDEDSSMVFCPENISTVINYSDEGIEAINDWIKNSPTPNFEKWINIDFKFPPLFKENLLTMQNITFVKNECGLCETLMWIYSLILKKSDFKLLLSDIKNSREYIFKLCRGQEKFKAYSDHNCYITPKDLCMMKWKDSKEASLFNATICGGDIYTYNLNKTYEECTTHISEIGEKTYSLPSKYVRELMRIEDAKNSIFYDRDNEEVGQYYEAGGSGNDYTSLLVVDKEKLFTYLGESDEQICWICKLRRESTNLAYEKFGQHFFEEKDKLYICWYDEGEFKSEFIGLVEI